MMDSNVLLTSIITASSILIAVGFPFIIFIATNHANSRENLLSEIKTYYPILNAFRELVYLIYSTGAIKSFKKSMSQAKTDEDKKKIKQDGAYSLYVAFDYIQRQYSIDILNDNNIYRTFSHNEIKYYKMYARDIYTYIINRHDTEIYRDRLKKDITLDKIRQIKQLIMDINPKYPTKEISINLIGIIAGDIAEEYFSRLENLTYNYEQPLHPIVKNVLYVLTVSSIVGVIIPLLLLQFPSLQFCYIIFTLVSMVCVCFIWIIVLTWIYILKKTK